MQDSHQQGVDPIERLADLVEESKRVYTETQNELEDLDVLLQQTSGEVEKFDQRTAQVTNRVRHIEANLNSYPREDIRDAYSASQASQLRLVMRIIEAQEGERRRLARQMHDGPAQSLSNLILQAEIVERTFGQGLEQARAELANLRSAVNATFEKTMDFIFELSPMMLDDLGAVPTLRRYIEDFQDKTGLGVTFDLVGEDRRLAPYVEVTIFRVIQELLRNVGQHAHAAHVQVNLNMQGSMVGIVVEDDGSGFDVEEVLASAQERRTLGIATMQRRVEMLGGNFKLDSSLGGGAKVTIQIPAA